LTQGQDYRGNQLLAKNISSKGYHGIIAEYVYVTPTDIQKILCAVPGAWEAFHGKGIDLGGGVACISSTIAQKSSVENIICVEVTEEVVKLCQPIVKAEILEHDQHKVISCIGDFNRLELEPNSLDFAVAWGSLPHSYQLVDTLVECRRVLKPEGLLVVIERAHDNSTPEAEINRLLNIQYDEAFFFLTRTYRDSGMILTRRDNGEHEYRYAEWAEAFRSAGFQMQSARVIRAGPEASRTSNDAGIPEAYIKAQLGGYLSSKVCPHPLKSDTV
jgi:ubiquinone/menaquinone biosynthesis C-methylase UbiE